MTSSPSSTSASMVKKMIGLPPGTITTSSGLTLMPRELETSAAMASRNSGNPAAGP